MAKAPITKRTVDAAKPATMEYVVWDDGGKETIKGFGLKVTPAGAKVYLYQYRLARPGNAAQTAPRKYTIGKHGDLTPDQARNRARELATMVPTASTLAKVNSTPFLRPMMRCAKPSARPASQPTSLSRCWQNVGWRNTS